RVTPFAGLEFALPAEALLLDASGFRLCAHQCRIASAVGFSEGVTAGNQRNCLLVIHRHAGERFADIPRRSDWIRLSIGPFRIHVDQTHLHCAERTLKITLAAVTLIRQPFAFGTPVDVFFGFPDILATAPKTER